MKDDGYSIDTKESLSRTITKDQMVALRRRLEFTQPTMAEQMGLSKSAYVAIETGAAQFRKIHALAAERVAEKWAHLLGRPEIIPYPVYLDMSLTLRRWSLDDLKEAQIKIAEGKIR